MYFFNYKKLLSFWLFLKDSNYLLDSSTVKNDFITWFVKVCLKNVPTVLWSFKPKKWRKSTTYITEYPWHKKAWTSPTFRRVLFAIFFYICTYIICSLVSFHTHKNFLQRSSDKIWGKLCRNVWTRSNQVWKAVEASNF